MSKEPILLKQRKIPKYNPKGKSTCRIIPILPMYRITMEGVIFDYKGDKVVNESEFGDSIRLRKNGVYQWFPRRVLLQSAYPEYHGSGLLEIDGVKYLNDREVRDIPEFPDYVMREDAIVFNALTLKQLKLQGRCVTMYITLQDGAFRTKRKKFMRSVDLLHRVIW